MNALLLSLALATTVGKEPPLLTGVLVSSACTFSPNESGGRDLWVESRDGAVSLLESLGGRVQAVTWVLDEAGTHEVSQPGSDGTAAASALRRHQPPTQRVVDAYYRVRGRAACPPLYRAIGRAVDALAAMPGRDRHLIVVTDGFGEYWHGDSPEGLAHAERIIEAARAGRVRIHVAAIAASEDAFLPWIERIASMSGGRWLRLDDEAPGQLGRLRELIPGLVRDSGQQAKGGRQAVTEADA